MGSKITRRRFIALSGAGALSLPAGPAFLLRAYAGDPSTRPGAESFHFISTASVPPQCRISHDFLAPSAIADDLPRAYNLRVVRASDMLNLRFVWESATFRKRERRIAGMMERHWFLEAGADAKLHVYFPSQHIIEKAYPNNPLGETGLVAPTGFSPESRLVFRAYADLGGPTNFLRYDLTTLLTWPWDMEVVPRALPPGQKYSGPDPSFPPESDALSQTYLILPWHTVLSPHAGERWRTRVGPTGPVSGTVELWHARLNDDHHPAPSIRVIGKLEGADPFNSLPGRLDREALCIETTQLPAGPIPPLPVPPAGSTDPEDTSGDPGIPRSVDVKELMLSSQGAYANLHVAWSNPELIPYLTLLPPGPSGHVAVDEWKQCTVWGRDQEVVIAYPGYVMPFGHPASLVHARERRIFKDADGRPYALLFDHYYCVIRQTIIDNYRLPADPPNDVPGAANLSQIQRGFPYCQVTLRPRVTPDLRPSHIVPDPDNPGNLMVDISAADWMYLAQPDDVPITSAGPQAPQANPRLFQFKVEAVDCQNKKHHFELPLFWVPLDLAVSGANVARAAAEYNSPANERHRTADMGGQRIGYVPQAPGQTDGNAAAHDSAVETRSMVFAVKENTVEHPAATDWPGLWYQGFYPQLQSAKVHLDQAAAFDRGPGASGVTLTYHDTLRRFGIGPTTPNHAELFARIAAEFNYDASKSGGMVTPSVSMTALSRKYGPWSRNEPIIPMLRGRGHPPEFDALSFFKSDALLLGADLLGLGSIAKDVEDVLDEVGQVPQMIGKVLAPLGKVVDEVESVIAECQSYLHEILARSQGYIKQLNARVQHFQEMAQQATDGLRSALYNEITGAVGTVQRQLTQLPFPDGPGALNLAAQLKALLLSAHLPEDVAEYYKNILLADADVIAALQTIWDDSAPFIAVLNAKIPVVCTRLDSTAQTAIQTAISLWTTDLTVLLKKIDKTLAQYQAFRAAQLKNVADVQARVLRDLDPEVYYQKLCKAFRPGLTALDKLEQFPLGPLQKLSKSLDELAQALHQPEKLLGEGTRLLKEILGEAQGVVALFSGGRGAHAMSRLDLPNLKAAFDDIAAEIIEQADPSLLVADVDETLALLADFLQQNNLPTLGGSIRGDVNGLLCNGLAGHPPNYVNVLSQWRDELKADLLADLQGAAGPTLSFIDTWVQDVGAQVKGFLDQLVEKLQGVIAEAEASLPFLPKELAVDFDWSPDLQDNALFKASLNGNPAALTISAHVRKSLKPDEISQAPEVTISGVLTSFTLNLIPEVPVLSAKVDSVTFKSVNGHSPDVSININSIELAEALKFLADLAKALNPKNGPFLKEIERGIETGFRFALPNITCAAFNVYNLKLVTGVQLWFDGSPMSLGLAICERDRPFVLAFGIFGGGGFVGLTLTPNGIETIEASLEFGAYVTLDIGVASGSGSVAAGIYFSTSTIKRTDGNPGKITKLYGYVHAHGEMSILGLVSLIEDFYLGLGYESRDGESLAVGEVIVSVEIDFCFFSITVDLHFRKEYRGTSAPTANGVRAFSEQAHIVGRRDVGATALASSRRAALPPMKDREMELLDRWEEYQSYFYFGPEN